MKPATPNPPTAETEPEWDRATLEAVLHAVEDTARDYGGIAHGAYAMRKLASRLRKLLDG